jgi:hypothetical protein
MPFVTSERAISRLVPALLCRGVCIVVATGLSTEAARVFEVVVESICMEPTAAEKAASVGNGPPRLYGSCEDDEVSFGVDRIGGPGLGLLACEGEEGFRASLSFFSFLENLLRNEDDEDMV